MSQSNQPPVGGPPQKKGMMGTAIMPQYEQGAPPAAQPATDSTLLSSGQAPPPGAPAGAWPGAGAPAAGPPGAQAGQPGGYPPGGAPPGFPPGGMPPGAPPGGYPPGGMPPGAPPEGFPPGGAPPGGFPPGGMPPGAGGFVPPGTPGGAPPGAIVSAANFCPPEDVESGKLMAVLGLIISPAWIIPLVTRDNAFSLYHAKQAAVLNIFAMIAGAIITVISVVTCGFGGFLAIALLAFLYPWIMGLIYAAQGQYRPMPWFGHFADKWFGGVKADKRPGSLPPQGGQQ